MIAVVDRDFNHSSGAELERTSGEELQDGTKRGHIDENGTMMKSKHSIYESNSRPKSEPR